MIRKSITILIALIALLAHSAGAQETLFLDASHVNPLQGVVGCYGSGVGKINADGTVSKVSSIKLNSLISASKKQISKLKKKLHKKSLKGKTSIVNQISYAKTLLSQQFKAKSCFKQGSKYALDLDSSTPDESYIHFSQLESDSSGFVFVLNGKGLSKDTIAHMAFDDLAAEFVEFGAVSSTSLGLRIPNEFSKQVYFRLIQFRKGRIARSAVLLKIFQASLDYGEQPTGTPTSGGSGNLNPNTTPTPTPTPFPTILHTPIPPPPIGQPGDHVATLEHDTPPGVSEYVIDSTIPLPKGMFTEAEMLDGVSPFVIDDGGTLRFMDATGFSKYPDAGTDGFDLVHVAARVHTRAGATSQFKIYYTPTQGAPWPSASSATLQSIVAASPLAIHPTVLQVFQPGMMTVEVRDDQNHLYTCDLNRNETGNVKIFSYGYSRLVMRVFCMTNPVAPVNGPNGTLPHEVGIFAYFTIQTGDEAMRVTIVASNAVSGMPSNSGNPLATAMPILYLKSLRLVINGQYGTRYTWQTPASSPAQIVSNQTIIDLMPARPDGKMHALPQFKVLPFEFTLHSLSSKGIAEGQVLQGYYGLAFPIEGQSTTNSSVPLYSPHNFATARIGLAPGVPVYTLAHLGLSSVRASLDAEYSKISGYFQNGLCRLNKTLETNPTPPAGGHACEAKRWRYFCDYPFIGMLTVFNSIHANLPINPNNSSTTNNCQEDPAGIAPSTIPYDGPGSILWGVQYGGMTGGAELLFTRGDDVWASRSRKGALELLLYATARATRNDKLHLLSGEPFGPLDALKQSSAGLYVPVRAFGGYDPNGCPSCDQLFGFNNAPQTQVNRVTAGGLEAPYVSILKNFMNEDEQHFLRNNIGNVKVAQYMFHPWFVDNVMHDANYSYFTHPNLPQYYQGNTPVYQSGALQGLRSSVAQAGTSAGRGEAHPINAQAIGYAMGSAAYRSFMLPYHQYLVRDVMYWSQMGNGLVHKTNNYSKNSVSGHCLVSRMNENSFLHVAINNVLQRALEGISPQHAIEAKAVLQDLGATRLITDFVLPQNSWYSPFVTVMIAHESNPGQLFTSWSSVPQNCKNDAFGNGALAGEDRLMLPSTDNLGYNSAQWDLLRNNLNLKYTGATTLDKLKKINWYNLTRGTNNSDGLSLGYCLARGATYCG